MAMLGLAIHTSSPGLGLALGGEGQPLRSRTWPLGRDLSTHLHSYLQDFIAPHRWADLAFIAVAQGPGGFTGTRIGVVTARTLAQQLDLPLFGISSLAAMAQHHCLGGAGVPAGNGAVGSISVGNDAVGGGAVGIVSIENSSVENSSVQNSAAENSSVECGAVGNSAVGSSAPPPARATRQLAVELRAQRGEVFGAIYTPTGASLQVAYPETVMPQADWEAVLAQWSAPCDRYIAEGDLSTAVTAVLTLAQARWQQGDRPHWSTVLPFYGQHPVQGMG